MNGFFLGMNGFKDIKRDRRRAAARMALEERQRLQALRKLLPHAWKVDLYQPEHSIEPDR